jgi:hypothetical protein
VTVAVSWYERQKARGLCCGCGAKSVLVRCPACMARAKVATRKLWASRRERGLCIRCSSPREGSKNHCPKCLSEKKLAIRERRGCKPWRPGGPGRRPISELK